MRAVAAHFVTAAEYLEQEAKSPTKHEYFNGHIYAMAGATPTHGIINSNVLIATGRRLWGRSCRSVSSDQRVFVAATSLRTYPDTLIVCPPEQYDEIDPNSLLNPTVIFEVLSPSTAKRDRSVKFDHYQQLPTLTDYILIAQDCVRVEHYQRNAADAWLMRVYNQREDKLIFSALELELPLEEIYNRLNLPAGLRMIPDDEKSC